MIATAPLRITQKVSFARQRRRRQQAASDHAAVQTRMGAGRVPRIARLMALAIRFEQLLRDGVVSDQAELGRLGHVTRARVTQIMNLLHLAPDIQEQILFLPRTLRGRDPVREVHVRPIASVVDWAVQRQLWNEVARPTDASGP